MIIPVKIRKRILTCKKRVVAGNIETYTVQFTFDEEWDTFEKRVIFAFESLEHPETPSHTVECALESDEINIPWEVIDSVGLLYITVKGIKYPEGSTDPEVLLTKLMDSPIGVDPHGLSDGDPAVDPSETIVDYLLRRINGIGTFIANYSKISGTSYRLINTTFEDLVTKYNEGYNIVAVLDIFMDTPNVHMPLLTFVPAGSEETGLFVYSATSYDLTAALVHAKVGGEEAANLQINNWEELLADLSADLDDERDERVEADLNLRTGRTPLDLSDGKNISDIPDGAYSIVSAGGITFDDSLRTTLLVGDFMRVGRNASDDSSWVVVLGSEMSLYMYESGEWNYYYFVSDNELTDGSVLGVIPRAVTGSASSPTNISNWENGSYILMGAGYIGSGSSNRLRLRDSGFILIKRGNYACLYTYDVVYVIDFTQPKWFQNNLMDFDAYVTDERGDDDTLLMSQAGITAELYEEFRFDISVNGDVYTATPHSAHDTFDYIHDALVYKPNVFLRGLMPDSSGIIMKPVSVGNTRVVFEAHLLNIVNGEYVPSFIRFMIESDNSTDIVVVPIKPYS